MKIKERLLEIKSECERRQKCDGCKFVENQCCVNGLGPCDWKDEFIDWLADRLERPKVKRFKPSEMYEVWQCPWCRTLYRYDEPDWKYCPICGAELER